MLVKAWLRVNNKRNNHNIHRRKYLHKNNYFSDVQF
jgi:hypothetical protein